MTWSPYGIPEGQPRPHILEELNTPVAASWGSNHAMQDKFRQQSMIDSD